MTDDLLLFRLSASDGFAEKLAGHLGVPLADCEQRDFEDGEHKSRPLVPVEGCDCFVLQSLYGERGRSVDDKLCRLLFFAATLKDHGAARVTALIPYLAYARKDRRTQPQDPVTTRYVAQLLEAVGVDRVVALEVHNLAAFENAFRHPAGHLEAAPLLCRWFLEELGGEPPVVVSPDAGGMKRAARLRELLVRELASDVPLALMEKQRSGGRVSGEAFAGDVDGRVAILVDDLVSTGGTLLRAARACRARGAVRVLAGVAHGLFTGDAPDVLADDALDRLAVTDSVPPFRLPRALLERKVEVLPAAALFADAVRRLRRGGAPAGLEH